MRYPVVIAALVAVSVFVLVLFLPVWIRLRARVGPESFALGIWVRLPFFPWYIPLPELTSDKMENLRRPKRSRTPKSSEPDYDAEPVPEPGSELGTDTASELGREPGPEPGPEVGRKSALERKKAPDAVPLTKRIRKGIASFREALPLVRAIVREVAGTVRVREMTVRGHLGVGDAFQTALLLGGVNSAAFLFLRIMRGQGFRFEKKPVIRFRPRYDAITFDARVNVETGISFLGCIKLALYLRRVTKSLMRPGKKRVSPDGVTSR